MPDIIIVADDLTGANASGVQLIGRGFSAETMLRSQLVPHAADRSSDALIFPTDSRALSAEAAYKRVFDTVASIRTMQATLVAKRIDSTLRGNLGAETDACLDALGDDRMAVVVPCFPSAGRTLVNGRLYVHGVPLDRTEAAADPRTPVRTADAAALFRRQSKHRVGTLHLNVLRSGTKAAADALLALYAGGVRIASVDSVDEADLAHAANALLASDIPFVSVDPGAFTAVLAAHMLTAPARPQADFDRKDNASEGRVLALIGSVNRVAAEQVRTLIERRDVPAIEVDTRALLCATKREREIRRIEALAAASGEQVLLVVSDGMDASKRIDLQAAGQHAAETDAAALINTGFADIGVRLISADASIKGLLTSGGDIAMAAYARLGADALALKAEIVPLGSFGRLVGGPHDGLAVVTKGGMVGDRQALVACLDYLLKQPDERQDKHNE